MKRRPLLILAAAFILLIPNRLFAWGNKGHAIVAEISFALLDSNTKQAVQKYLGAMTIEDAANWMDDVRSGHMYDYQRTWHYVDFDKGTQYVATKEGNIVNALNKAIDELYHKDKLSKEEIKKDLLLVFHLVGDIHQPLHTGYSTDKGGNDVTIKYLKEQTNLHRVWDTEIIESERISANDCLLLMKNFDANEIARFKTIDVENWLHQPRSLLGNVYNFNEDNTIDQAYINRNKKIIETQLLIAGIRLSAILQATFKS